jgi:hypothetical protein
VPAVQARDDGPIRGVERGEEAGHPVADVVVRAPLGHVRHHRECGLGARQYVNLGLLVHAVHNCTLGSIEVEPDDVVDLVDEQRVVRQREPVGPMRLHFEGLPDPADRRGRQPRTLRHLRSRPVRRVLRDGLQRGDDHVLDLSGGDRRRTPGAGIVDQPLETRLHEPSPPLPDRRLVHPLTFRDRLVRQALSTGQDDPGT